MRAKVLTVVIVLALLGVLCTTEQTLVLRTTNEALAGAREVLALLRADAIGEALERARALDGQWDERAKRLEIFVNHKATDDVRFAFSRLIAALESGERDTAMVYAAELEGGVEHVYERQALMVENIL